MDKKFVNLKPKWLHVKFPLGKNYNNILKLSNNINTICNSGSCPNIGQCWGKGVATFMILGNICTRSCKFCGIKTGKHNVRIIMLGLGETEEEVIQTLKDSKKAKIDIITIGQYLSPSIKHLPVKNFIHPFLFKKYEKIALDMGFLYVESGPLVRSSYNAYKHIL
uniref:hypothetical protein n=1 Tax=Candidatus Karelsulcia muelleri TaxID=336810 RepID=UPI00374C8BEB